MGEQRQKNFITLVGRTTFAIPAVEAANAGACTIVTDVAISGLTAGALTIAAQPDYPRTLKLVVTDANGTITGATCTITGINQNGVFITETVSITGAGSFYSVNAFAYVTSATWALVSGTVTASNDKIAIGVGLKLGLPAGPDAIYDRMIRASFNGAYEAGTFNATYGTYDPSGTMDGTKAVEVTFRYRVPIEI